MVNRIERIEGIERGGGAVLEWVVGLLMRLLRVRISVRCRMMLEVGEVRRFDTSQRNFECVAIGEGEIREWCYVFGDMITGLVMMRVY